MRTPLSLSKLAYVLNLPADWLKAEAEAGRLPCLRVGERLLFDRPAAEQALAERAAGERIGE